MGGCVLDRVMTQAEFGDLVGITQQAVSDLQRRGVLKSNVTGKAWLLAYCEQLRQEAAGRAGKLAEARAALDNERREEIAMRNAIKRAEYAPVALIEQVLARVGRQVAGVLDGLVPSIRLRWPDVTSDQLQIIEGEVARARNTAAQISLQQVLAEDVAEQDQAA